MEKYTITINDCDYEVFIIRDSGTEVEVNVNGVRYMVDVRNSHDRKPASMTSVQRPSARPASPSPPVASSAVNPGERAGRRPGAATAAPFEGVPIQAPMPGVVLEIVVTVGQKVKHGDLVARVEAMKMENDLYAPADGTVKEIRAERGDQVREHDVLVVLGV